MKKNLFQSETRAEIISRIDSLKPDAKSQWGKMNVNQMLRHTTYGLQNAMDEMPVSGKKSNGLKKSADAFRDYENRYANSESKGGDFS